MLTSTRIQEINATVSDLLSTIYKDPHEMYPPVPFADILQSFGLSLKEGSFKDTSISGANDKAEKTIFIAEDDPATRQRFTIAHELGHFILHKQKKRKCFIAQKR